MKSTNLRTDKPWTAINIQVNGPAPQKRGRKKSVSFQQRKGYDSQGNQINFQKNCMPVKKEKKSNTKMLVSS